MLQIHNVRLENFCQHDALSLDFRGGITVILGPNGSGKSNLTHGIYAALTGSFNRGPGDATKCIGLDRDGPCSVQVAGSIHDRPFRIRREIRRGRDGTGKVSHALWLDEDIHKTYKTAGEIDEWLEKGTGLSSDILAFFLFPGRASERAEKFAALCGTRRYRKIREGYMKLLGEDRKRYENARVKLDFLDDALRSAETHLHTIDTAIAELQKQIGGADLKNYSEQLKTELAELTAAQDRIKETENRLDTLTKEYAIREGQYRQACHDGEESERLLAEIAERQKVSSEHRARIQHVLNDEIGDETYEQRVDRLSASVQANEKRALLERTIAETDAELAAVPQTRPIDPAENLKLRTELDTVLARIGSLGSELATLEAVIPLLDTFGPGERSCNCPFCGAEPAHWKNDIDHFRTRQEELLQERTGRTVRKGDLETRLRDLEGQQKQYESDQRQRTRLQVLRERQAVELAACPACDPEASARLARLEKLRHDLMQLETVLPELTAQAERETSQLAGKQQRKQEMRETLRRLESETQTLQTEMPRPEEVERWNDSAQRLTGEIDRIDGVLRKLAERECSRTESIRQRDDLARQRREYALIADEGGPTERWLDRCESALDWFHHDRLPRLIHKAFLDLLVKTVNRNLVGFRNPFAVRVNEDVSFDVRFPDGETRESKALSVGESDLLGISFLGAINLTSAQKLGIMVIDEPTASLDADNLVSLFQVLDEWKKDMVRQNRQLIIVTHVEEMAAIADTVFRLPPRPDRILSA